MGWARGQDPGEGDLGLWVAPLSPAMVGVPLPGVQAQGSAPGHDLHEKSADGKWEVEPSPFPHPGMLVCGGWRLTPGSSGASQQPWKPIRAHSLSL